MRDYETLLLEAPRPGVMLVTLVRPEAANAMNTQMVRDLLGLFERLGSAEGALPRCVVVTGAGERYFCAGGDLKERNGMTDGEWRVQHALAEEMVRRLHDVPVPVLAAVNGAAYGGGCELVLNMDFAYAAETARFCLPETRIGIMPGTGGTQALLRAAGPRRAKELVFSAREFSAAEARDWSVVNDIRPRGDLLAFVLDRADVIAANAPLAVMQAKKALRHGADMDHRTALYFEIEAYNRLVGTRDRREGVAAFNERRRPVFTGE